MNHRLPLDSLDPTQTGHPDFPEAAAEARGPSVSFAATKLPFVTSRLRPEAAGRHLIRIAAIRAMAACYTPMCQMGRISSLKCRLLLFPSCYLVLRVVPAFKQ